MIELAEQQGKLKPGMTIIEPTSGNTGIGIAIACAVKGYNFIACIPVKMSIQKVQMIQHLGGQVVWTPLVDESHPNSYMNTAARLAEEMDNAMMLDQFSNMGNPLAHYMTTGNEVVAQTDGTVTHFVCAPGTGGTLTGAASRIKELVPSCEVVCADPIGSLLAIPDELNYPPGAGSYLV